MVREEEGGVKKGVGHRTKVHQHLAQIRKKSFYKKKCLEIMNCSVILCFYYLHQRKEPCHLSIQC